ncbi:MAG: hypothetical protein JRD93_01655 [Deltaproteobacteria bacterium]|nr:hypothetical protein [Deltaproteobacteria bacterium]
MSLYRFLRSFRNKIKPIINTIDAFIIFTNFSAYLPVNAILSRLMRNKKCRQTIGIGTAPEFKIEIDILRSLYLSLFTFIFRLTPVYYHMRLSYLYVRKPRRKILEFNNPFMKMSRFKRCDAEFNPVYNVFEPIIKRSTFKKNIIIIYGDTTVYEAYGCSLPYEIYVARLRLFFDLLSHHYKECKLIYKPHPSDQSKVMPGLKNIKFELYNGRLISEIHLEQNIQRVRACYSVASTSLLYSASRGIPSYMVYRYLEFNSEYPRAFFENENVCENPFLYNIKSVDEIGAIDSINVSPVENDCGDDWAEIINL